MAVDNRGYGDLESWLGIPPLINLTGTLTSHGGASACAEAVEAASAMMRRGVDIVDLQARASRVIAEATGAEAGFVAACSSAGICMAVAGAMTGDDLARIERLPDSSGMRNEVVIQAGHVVNYGHSIAQDVRLPGARPVVVGDVNAAKSHQLQAAIGPATAAGLFVVSHHCVQEGQVPFTAFRQICHDRGIPVIVDLAAEYDLHGYLRQGADITIHSSHKFLSGPTAGIVAGRKALVRAAYLQSFGIARPMKAGKESIAGALAALKVWTARDHAADRRRARDRLDYWRSRLEGYPGIVASIDPDPTGNPFERLKVSIDAGRAGLSAVQLVCELETGNPPIAVRAHDIEHGCFVMDPRSLGEGELEIVAARIRGVLDAARAGTRTSAPSDVHQWKLQKAQALREWPDGSAALPG